jgi:hypothetical protein
LAGLVLTSCGDIRQDLYLNADGSGKLEASFELGEMMSMMKGFGEMNVNDVTISEAEEPDTIAATEEPKDPMQNIIDRVTDPEYPHDFDTLMPLLDIMPDSVRKKETRPDLVKRIAFRVQSPAKSADLTFGVVIDFKDQHQLKDIVNHLDTLDGANLDMPTGGGGGLPKESFMVFEADMKAGWIRFDSVDYAGLGMEMGMGGMPGDSLMSSEDAGMMEMMFGNSKIKTVVHVPGEVNSCTNKDAILTKDNKVIIEHGFMDIMKVGKVPGYTIHFTPRN